MNPFAKIALVGCLVCLISCQPTVGHFGSGEFKPKPSMSREAVAAMFIGAMAAQNASMQSVHHSSIPTASCGSMTSMSASNRRNDGFGTTMNPYDFRNESGIVHGETYISGNSAYTTYTHPNGQLSHDDSYRDLLGWSTTHYNADGTMSHSTTTTDRLGIGNETTYFNSDGSIGHSTQYLDHIGTGSTGWYHGSNGATGTWTSH